MKRYLAVWIVTWVILGTCWSWCLGQELQTEQVEPHSLVVLEAPAGAVWLLPDGVEYMECSAVESRAGFVSPARGKMSVRALVPIIDWEAKTFRFEQLRWTVVVDDDDPPDPPDPPDPTKAPFPSAGYAVMIIREASEAGRLPAEQAAIFNSSQVIRYCWSHAVKVDGGPFFRIWDDDYRPEDLSNVPAPLVRAYTDVREQAAGRLPWIAISTGKDGYSGPLPGTVDDTMALLERWSNADN